MGRTRSQPGDPAVAHVAAMVAYLKAERLTAGLTQEQLGAIMYPGRDGQSLISEWETGVSQPEAVNLVRWALALGVRVRLD